MKTIKIPELKIEIEKSIHHKDKTFADGEKDCPKGWEIATYEILQWLRNSKYRDKLGLLYTWEFVQNPDLISKKRGDVARFDADSVGVDLYCGGGSSNRDAHLGLRYFRRLKK